MRHAVRIALVLLLLTGRVAFAETKAEWKPVEGNLMTQWAKDVSPDNALPEYPRPQMVRANWHNLNGLWELAVTGKDDARPESFDKQILVPYPIESALSGVKQRVSHTNRIWYRRTFELPDDWKGQQILLHFGGVDWETTVTVNGKELGVHRGGYDAFSYDITDALNTEGGPQELVVSVWDPTSAGDQPRGKQVQNPGGIFYTPSSGIWQTVWLEPVPSAYIRSLKIVPDVDNGSVLVTADVVGGQEGDMIRARVALPGNKYVGRFGASDKPIRISLADDSKPRLWSPDSPYLYDLQVTLHRRRPGRRGRGGSLVDAVDSYFGMRKISLGKDERGITRLLLNNKPLFHIGPLDQGFWPDGLYTAPTDEALRYDVAITRKMGFNTARKHVKIEPARWYYWCDKLGLMVWQDMPNGNNRSDEAKKQFELELTRMVDGMRNHPSIVIWVPYNEGWGQHDTPRIVELVKKLDPTRLVNQASGWHDRGVGDMHDIHSYPRPKSPDPESSRAAVLGEFGGLGLMVDGHTWGSRAWGYQKMSDNEQLMRRYEELLDEATRLRIAPGLSAAIYTQTTDVETETNGLLSYDRAVVKMDPRRVAKANWGYIPPMFTPPGDQFIDDTAVELTHVHDQAQLHYTRDGSEPTKASPRYTAPIPLRETTSIKARAFWPDGTESATAAKTFKKVEPRKPSDVASTESGLRYEYYEGDWSHLPNFDQIKPVATGTATEPNVRPKKRGDGFALKFSGYIDVPRDGIYAFYTTSDDGSLLRIGDEQVVNNDGLHGPVERSGHIALAAGRHPITIACFEAGGGEVLEVRYEGPGIKKQLVPASALSH